MNILIFNWRDIKHEWAGGSEVYIFELARRWVKMGHTVTLFCGQDVREKLPDEETMQGVKIIRKGGRFTIYIWAVIYYLMRLRKACDVLIDVQNGIPFFTPLYSRKPKLAIVYHVHGDQFFVELPFPLSVVGYVMEKFLFPMFYSGIKIMAISKTTKNDLVKLGFRKKSIEIVYCGINGKKPIRQNKKFTAPTILYLGRIKKYKRVDMLIKIMPQIVEIVPSAHLLIAGWGTEGTSVTDISMRSVNRKRVKIVGPVSEKEKRYLLSRSWVFVNPSIGEGWGISIIEANLHGTPAVAFDVAGLSESIKNGETGVLVKSEKELVASIGEVLIDKRYREKLSKNAISWSSKFNWDDAASQSIKIMKQVSAK